MAKKADQFDLRIKISRIRNQEPNNSDARVLIKKKVLESWNELIHWQSIYLEEVRKAGGTMGHKVGSLRDQQKSLKKLFESL